MAIGGPTSSNLGSGLLKTVLGGVSKAVPYVGAGLQIGSAIANLFRKSPDGQQKINDTKTQQAIESTARSIEQQVNSGQLDPDLAIRQLRNLMVRGGTSTAGAQLANLTVQQVISNIQQKRMWNVNSTYSPGENTSGTNTFQNDRMAALLHSGLLGGEATKNMTSADAPLAKLWEPHQDVGAGFAKYYDQMDKLNPDPRKSTAYTQLGEALRNQIKRFGG